MDMTTFGADRLQALHIGIVNSVSRTVLGAAAATARKSGDVHEASVSKAG